MITIRVLLPFTLTRWTYVPESWEIERVRDLVAMHPQTATSIYKPLAGGGETTNWAYTAFIGGERGTARQWVRW